MQASGYNHGVEPMLYLDMGEQDMAPIESPLVTYCHTSDISCFSQRWQCLRTD